MHDTPHISLTGTVTFKNPHGYLSAEHMPQFYTYLFISFMLILPIWPIRMFLMRKYIFKLHWLILVTQIVCCFEAIAEFVRWEDLNLSGD